MTTITNAPGLSTGSVAHDPAWLALKDAAIRLQPLQTQDGSIPEPSDHALAAELVERIIESIDALAPRFPHEAQYLSLLVGDFRRWATNGFRVPDFLNSLVAFQPQLARVDGLQHLVVFPMYTQNGSRDRHVEAVLF